VSLFSSLLLQKVILVLSDQKRKIAKQLEFHHETWVYPTTLIVISLDYGIDSNSALLRSVMKGILLAGGTGTRLYPLTIATSKQLLAVYDKPMIYYPLSTLMLSGIREILIITTPRDLDSFKLLLGDGSQLGLRFQYIVQNEPRGIAEALVLGESFIDGGRSALILGDNIFYGNQLNSIFLKARERDKGATIFAASVKDPSAYGVVEVDGFGKAVSIEEKPVQPKSNLAVTGMYFYDEQVCEYAKGLKPSHRGELEITDINRKYMDAGLLNVLEFGRGIAWLDTGTHKTMLEASQFVSTIEERQGLKVACIEEIALSQGFIDDNQFSNLIDNHGKSDYAGYLKSLV